MADPVKPAEQADNDTAAWEPAAPPPGPPATSVGELIALTAGAIGLAVLDHATGLVSLLGAGPDTGDHPELVIPPDLDQTAAPVIGPDGKVPCSRCRRAVPYATMAINEHGYFCASCGPSRPSGGATG